MDTRPRGWSRNPSDWRERAPLVIVALVGVAVAGYLSAFQMHWIGSVWEPFFGRGSHKILTSSVSTILPLPDAALGALGYLADAVAGVVGGRERWRTMPWIVIIFGIGVGPLGAVSVALVILQPVAFDAFCTLCLFSAVISVGMIGPAMDEVLASLQYLARTRARGERVWPAFWRVGDSGLRAQALDIGQAT